MKAAALKNSSMRFVAAVFICAVFFLATISVGAGLPFRTGKVPGNFGCSTCHYDPKGGGQRNPFGQDYERIGIPAGEKYTEKLGALDSDGDGSTNKEEFAAGTHPGNSNWKP